ncbi:MAG: DUF2974 domain-containing protein [bacterium]|nr:DUF2974 domain-containing protein [bacterium]
MGELTDKELLLLSNYMYMDVSVTKGSIKDILASVQDADGNIDPSRISASGGIDDEGTLTILNEMNAASDDFKALRITEVVNSEGIRGACFENTAGEGTVVFRGTGGGYQSWVDNILGGYQKDTAMQKEAADFINQQCGRYSNLTVAGHSKGGNLAQYVTVMCGNQVDRCVSYDGQGQNRNFILSNSEKVRQAQGKITSISAHNDFVNILLTSIAGREIFVQNKGHGKEAHSMVRLLTDNEFDPVTGRFVSFQDQDPGIRELKAYLGNGVILLDELPSGISKEVYSTLAGILAGVLSTEKSLKYELTSLAVRMNRLTDAVRGGISDGFEVSFSLLKQAQEELNSGIRNITAVRDTLEGVMSQGDQDLYTKLLVKKLMMALLSGVEAECTVMDQMQTAMESITASYLRGENTICSCIQENVY